MQIIHNFDLHNFTLLFVFLAHQSTIMNKIPGSAVLRPVNKITNELGDRPQITHGILRFVWVAQPQLKCSTYEVSRVLPTGPGVLICLAVCLWDAWTSVSHNAPHRCLLCLLRCFHRGSELKTIRQQIGKDRAADRWLVKTDALV